MTEAPVTSPRLRDRFSMPETTPRTSQATVDTLAAKSATPTISTPPLTIAPIPREEVVVTPTPEWIVRIKRWFTEGNVPVKVGVIVLFLGVAALLKYAADAGWLTVPIEFRLAAIAILALAVGALLGDGQGDVPA